MPPLIATAVCAVGILGLFWLDRNQKVRTSGALWIPVIWLLIACSRPVSQWLNLSAPIDAVNAVMEGSPIDRFVFIALLSAALIVLVGRSREILRLLGANGPILLFLLYCALSLLWSDFPGVAFKRWTKALGDFAVVLIVLSDPDLRAAVERLLARLAYVLIPLSILFIKYYPELGRGYSEWTGAAVYTGVTTNKNTLGAVCMLLGLGALWRFLATYKDHQATGRIQRMIAQGVILAMTLWLFQLMDAKTSLCTFVMASVLLLAANSRAVNRSPAIAHVLVFSMLAVSVSILFLGVDPGVLKAIGRNPTLTERTDLWATLLGQARNALFGTGFESFWLGPRLAQLWRLNPWQPNEAHDGYLEIYLNLGWTGVVLLAVILARGYRTVFAAWRRHLPLGDLRLAYFFVGLVFNFTEAAFFKITAPVWIFFLLAITKTPESSNHEIQMSAPNKVIHTEPLSRIREERGSWSISKCSI
jgi:exopolysaccharide production protein ExoQ